MTITITHPDILDTTVTIPSRSARLATGDLIDATPIARKMRFPVPVAITAAAWADSVHWDEEIEESKAGFSAQDVDGRLHDLVWEAVCTARASRGGRRHNFDHVRVPIAGRGMQPGTVEMAISIGPGDSREPVITISLADEDMV